MTATTFEKTLTFAIKGETEPGKPYRFVATTDSVDREGDVLIPEGMDSRAYEMNPIVLWLHKSNEPSVAVCERLYRSPGKVEMDMVFPPKPAGYDTANGWRPDEFKAMVDSRLINAVSVRGNAKDTGVRKATAGDRAKYGPDCERVFHRWSLLEISLVPIGMNQDAVRIMATKGLITPEACEKYGLTAPAAQQEIVKATPVVHTISVRVPRHGALDRVEAIRHQVQKRAGRIYAS